MSRSEWKGKFISNVFFKKTLKTTKIWSRASTIPANLIGKTVAIHNGKDFKNIYITSNKIGFKFGQFVFTKKYTHKYKNNIKNLKVKKK